MKIDLYGIILNEIYKDLFYDVNYYLLMNRLSYFKYLKSIIL